MSLSIYRFSINLSAQECKEYYQGLYTSVKVMSDVGKTVMFPAHRLRPFMTVNGVRGVFALYLDNNNKFVRLEKLNKN